MSNLLKPQCRAVAEVGAQWHGRGGRVLAWPRSGAAEFSRQRRPRASVAAQWRGRVFSAEAAAC
jgi:hypothetical protein